MRKIELEQGTPEWLEWRSSRWMASEAAIVMAAVPSWFQTQTWDDLRAAKAGLAPKPSEFVQNQMNIGHYLEPIARAWAIEETGHQFEPACIESDTGKFAASLDGIAEGAWLEVKCVSSRAKWHHNIMFDYEIPEYIRWQLLGQWVALDQNPDMECYLAIWDHHDHNQTSIRKINLKELAHPLGQEKSLIEDLKNTWQCFDGGLDTAWTLWAQQWQAGVQVRDGAQERVDEAARELLKIANGREVQACGVRATTTTRRGSIDWQGFARDQWSENRDILEEAELYRRKSTTSHTIRGMK